MSRFLISIPNAIEPLGHPPRGFFVGELFQSPDIGLVGLDMTIDFFLAGSSEFRGFHHQTDLNGLHQFRAFGFFAESFDFRRADLSDGGEALLFFGRRIFRQAFASGRHARACICFVHMALVLFVKRLRIARADGLFNRRLWGAGDRGGEGKGQKPGIQFSHGYLLDRSFLSFSAGRRFL